MRLRDEEAYDVVRDVSRIHGQDGRGYSVTAHEKTILRRVSLRDALRFVLEHGNDVLGHGNDKLALLTRGLPPKQPRSVIVLAPESPESLRIVRHDPQRPEAVRETERHDVGTP